jgi:hypothetical protein
MRFLFWRKKLEVSKVKRRRWHIRFFEMQRRRRFRLAELARDPLELQLSAFKGPLA